MVDGRQGIAGGCLGLEVRSRGARDKGQRGGGEGRGVWEGVGRGRVWGELVRVPELSARKSR